MKKTRFMFLACLVSSFLMASVTYAEVGPYVSGQAGATWLQDADISGTGGQLSFDMGYNVGASGGYDFGPVRVEGEMAYRQNDIDKVSPLTDGDVSAFSLLANGFFDIEIPGPVTPYLGAGIGAALVTMDVSNVDDEDTVLAYQLAAGVSIDLIPALALDLGYRYFATSDPEFENAVGDSEYQSHNVNIGMRYTF